ncbi:hypothetical protein KFE25_011103 [Diacronema lutheri]|uniref:Uncharacterized protein n=2 Tax=Diacronema lutheri TaxID=2081491 RepID=A0A8J5X7T4_DIALT|nr:hypothetical protein KFE25_011103 [Diacronema lutheri]
MLRAANVVALLLVARQPVAGRLTVTAGAFDVAGVGERLTCAPYAFTTRAFDVEGPLVYTTHEEWSYPDESFTYRACPPRYAGAANLTGALVIIESPRYRTCSYLSHARAVEAAGGAALLVWDKTEVFLRPEPGRRANYWTLGEPRVYDGVPAADITSLAAAPLVSLARARVPMRARARPDMSAFARVWSSPVWAAWQLLLGAYTLATAEFVLSQLLAFVLTGGARLGAFSLPIAVLVVELASTTMRAAAFVDPAASRGLFAFPWGHLLTICLPDALAPVSWAIFLTYFMQAAHQRGMATARATSWAHALGVGAFSAILIGSLVAIDFVAVSPTWIAIKLVLYPVVYPSAVLALGTFHERQVRQHESWLPGGVFARLCTRLRRAIVFGAAAVTLSVFLSWAAVEPHRFMLLVGSTQALRNVITLTIAGSFVPSVGTRPRRGPLWRACAALGAAALALVKLATSPLLMSVHPRASDADGADGASAAGGGGGEMAEEDLGVSLALLREIARSVGHLGEGVSSATVGRAAAELCGSLGDPAVGSLARVYRKASTTDGRAAVGAASVVVVHESDGSFDALLGLLAGWSAANPKPSAADGTEHERPPHYFWIDFACVRAPGRRVQPRAVPRSARTVVLALESVLRPMPLARLDCLYQLLLCDQHGLPLDLALTAPELHAVSFSPDAYARAFGALAGASVTRASGDAVGVTLELVVRQLDSAAPIAAAAAAERARRVRRSAARESAHAHAAADGGDGDGAAIGPRASTAASRTSIAAPRASTAASRTSTAATRSSMAAPRISIAASRTSTATPRPSASHRLSQHLDAPSFSFADRSIAPCAAPAAPERAASAGVARDDGAAAGDGAPLLAHGPSAERVLQLDHRLALLLTDALARGVSAVIAESMLQQRGGRLQPPNGGRAARLVGESVPRATRAANARAGAAARAR